MIGAKNFIVRLIDQWLQKWSDCKILSWDSIKPQKETFQERIFKSTQRYLFWMILTLWPKSCPISTYFAFWLKNVSPLFSCGLWWRGSSCSLLRNRGRHRRCMACPEVREHPSSVASGQQGCSWPRRHRWCKQILSHQGTRSEQDRSQINFFKLLLLWV